MKFKCRQKSNTRFKVSSNLGTFLAILSTWSQCKSTSLQWAISSGKVCCAIERTAVYKLHIQSWSALFLWSLLLYIPTTYDCQKQCSYKLLHSVQSEASITLTNFKYPLQLRGRLEVQKSRTNMSQNLWVALFTITTAKTTFFSAVVESTAANRVGNDKKHQHDYVYDCHLSPVLLHVLKNPGLARSAVEAKVGIAPNRTVRVCSWWWGSHLPFCCSDECKTTTGRWLATARLHNQRK